MGTGVAPARRMPTKLRKKVRLVGNSRLNSTCIGTQVRIDLGDKVLTRQVEGSTGQSNQNDPTLHFGLGSVADRVKLQIRWPDGTRRGLEIPVDRTVTVQYGSG